MFPILKYVFFCIKVGNDFFVRKELNISPDFLIFFCIPLTSV